MWDPFNKGDIAQLEHDQRKVVRHIFNVYRRHDSPTLIMCRHCSPTLESRRKVSCLAFLHNCVSRTINIKLTIPAKPHSTRKTRHTHDRALTPIFARTNALASFIKLSRGETNYLQVSSILAIFCMNWRIIFAAVNYTISCVYLHSALTILIVVCTSFLIFTIDGPSCLDHSSGSQYV